MSEAAAHAPCMCLTVPQGLTDRITAVGWLPLRSHETLVVVPSEQFRLSAFIPADEAFAVEFSLGGPLTYPARYRDARNGWIIVITFTPLGIFGLLHTPVGNAADCRLKLGDIYDDAAVQELECRLRGAASPETASCILLDWIAARQLPPSALPHAAMRVVQATELLATVHSSQERMPEVAESLGVTRRQLERDFVEWVGVAPAAYRRLARFQTAARALLDGESAASAAMQCGFADQSHMTHTMRSLALSTPRRLCMSSRIPMAIPWLRPGGRLEVWRSSLAEIDPSVVEALPDGCPIGRLRQRIARSLQRA